MEQKEAKLKKEEEEGKDGISESTNHIEKSRALLMRAIVENQDPSSKEVDDSTMRRFLRARGLDVEKGASMLLKCLKWRQSFVPNGQFSPSEIPNEIAQNKMFVQGTDRQGRPICVCVGVKHYVNKIGGIEEFKRFVVFAVDKICARMPLGQEKFVIIGDMEGWGYANCDIRAYLAAIPIFQDYYPERVGKIYLINVPYFFMTAWKVVHPFIDITTKKKVVFVERKKLKETLLEDIDESQLPEVYGGKLPLVPVQDA